MTSRSSEPEQPASGEPDCVRRTTHQLSDAMDNALLTTSEETTDLESDGTEIGVTSATMLRSSCSGMASSDPITCASSQRNRRSLWMVAVEASVWTSVSITPVVVRISVARQVNSLVLYCYVVLFNIVRLGFCFIGCAVRCFSFK